MSPPTLRARRESRLPPQRVETVLAGWLAGATPRTGSDKGVCRLWPQSPSLSYGHWPDRLPSPQAGVLLRPHEQTTQENQPGASQIHARSRPKNPSTRRRQKGHQSSAKAQARAETLPGPAMRAITMTGPAPGLAKPRQTWDPANK